jgi:hypothetical protein
VAGEQANASPKKKTSSSKKKTTANRAAVPTTDVPSADTVTAFGQSDLTAGEAKPVPLRRRNTDQQVETCLQNNFKGYERPQVDLTIIGGKNLRKRLRDDIKRQRKDSGFVRGPKYFDLLRTWYASANSPLKALKIKDNSQKFDKKMVKAFKV